MCTNQKGSHKLTGKKTASTTPKYLHHPEDVYWQSGGRGRIKFIVDNQALANIVNGRQKLGESPLTAVFKRFIRACTAIFKHQYYPQTNIGDMVQWRSRDFNQQADHIANVTLDTQSGQYYCDKTVMREAKEAKANFLIFSDGGYRSSIPCSVGAYIIYAVFDNYTRPVVAQGIILRGYTGSFPAEAVALETAASNLISWLLPIWHSEPCGLGFIHGPIRRHTSEVPLLGAESGDSIGDHQFALVVFVPLRS